MLMFVFQTPHSKECSTARPENHVESWEGKPFTNILSPQCYIIVWTPRSSGKWLTSWALVVFGAPTNATASPQRSNWPLPGAIPVISGCSKPQSFGVPSYGHDHHGFTHTHKHSRKCPSQEPSYKQLHVRCNLCRRVPMNTVQSPKQIKDMWGSSSALWWVTDIPYAPRYVTKLNHKAQITYESEWYVWINNNDNR